MMKAITFNPTTKALEIIHLPIPTPKEDEVLIRIKAFGLNRSDFLPCHSPLSNHTGSSEEEHSDPQGQIPSTEAVGVIVSPTALSSPYNSNQKVPAVLISLPLFPRKIEQGTYAEYITFPNTSLQHIRTSLSWEVLAAMPNAFHIAWSALIQVLGLRPRERILIRGTGNEIGRAAVAVARSHGASVVGSISFNERNGIREMGEDEENGKMKEKEGLVRESGADTVVWDYGCLAARVGDFAGYHTSKEGKDKIEGEREGVEKEKVTKEYPSSSSSSWSTLSSEIKKPNIGPPFDKVLHLTSQSTLGDSLRCAKRGATVCFIPTSPSSSSSSDSNPNSSNSNTFTISSLADLIPPETKLTVYKPTADQFMTTPFQALVNQVETGKMKVHVGRVFNMDEIGEAWKCLMNEDGGGKVIVLV